MDAQPSDYGSGGLKNHSFILIVCAIFTIAGFLRLNDLSVYTPDSTRYLIWGNSIARGDGFLDTTQPEPDRTVVHAPFYAVLIAPVELLFPLSLTAVKIWTLFFGVLSIALFYLYLDRTIGRSAARVGAILLACNPLLLTFSTEALSEAPFIALTLLTLLLVERVAADQRTGKSLALLVLCVACIGLLREVGISVAIAVAAYFGAQKQWRRVLLISAPAALLLTLWYLRNHAGPGGASAANSDNLSFAFQHIVTDPGSSIVNELALRTVINLRHYFAQLGGMIFYPLFATQQLNINIDGDQVYGFFQRLFEYGYILVILVAIPLLVAGAYRDVKSSPTATVRLLLSAAYVLMILVYPIKDIRFLAPLLPLSIYFCLRGAQWLASKRHELRGPATRYALASALLMIPNIYCIQKMIGINLAYRRSPVEFCAALRKLPSYPAVFTQPWSLFGEWIRGNLPADVVIASPTKDLAIAVGGRKVLELNAAVALPVFESVLRDNAVDYIAAPIRWQDFIVYELLMRETRRFWFEPVYRIANLNLFKVYSKFEHPAAQTDPADPADPFVQPGDSTTASNLLRKGRSELLDERYVEANRTLIHAVELDSLQPEVVYQCMVSHLMLRDKPAATSCYQRLLTLPQAGAYISPARRQFELYDLLSDAQQSKFHEELAVKTRDAAQGFWKLGYYRRAQSVLDAELRDDSVYFKGLLWGFHFNFQLNDSARSRQYLGILRHIDDTNQVVRSFTAAVGIDDSLRTVEAPGGRSRLHMTLARLYRKIELNDEAVDEAERAAGEDPNGVDAWQFIGSIYDRRSRSRAARNAYLQVALREPKDALALAKIDSLGRVLSVKQ